jgi:hypothetical protein
MGRAQGNHPDATTKRRVTRRKQKRSAPWRWDHDDRLEIELLRFTAGRTTWPTRTEFAAAHRSDLYCAVLDYGGIRYWAARLGLELSARQLAKVPYPTSAAVAEARELIDRVGHLPGPRLLRELGHGRLASAVKAAGGSARFRTDHGL